MGVVAEWFSRNRRLLGAAFLLSLLVLGIWRVRAVLAPFVLAGVLAYLLNPLVNMLVGRGFSRLTALVFIYLIVILAGVVLVGLIVPTIVIELNRLAEFLPAYFDDLQVLWMRYQEEYSRVQLPGAVRQAIDDLILTVQSALLDVVAAVGQGVLGIFGALFSLVLAPVLSFYLLKDLDRLRGGLRRYIPGPQRPGLLGVLSEIDAVLAGFVRGQLIVVTIVGFLVTGALLLLDVRFAVILGIFAGLTEIVPYFGPAIGALPALAVAAAVSPWLAFKVLVAFVLIQQVEAQVLSPRIMSKNVGLHPLMVIFALLAGFELYGIWGMVAAVPVAGVGRVALGRLMGQSPARAAPEGADPGQRGAEPVE